MRKETEQFLVEKTRALLASPECCAEAKQAGQAWLDAVGTADEAAATQRYLTELEEDIVTIDGLYDFAASPIGEEILGAEGAKQLQAHAQQLKASGAAFCDCSACSAAAAILGRRAELL